MSKREVNQTINSPAIFLKKQAPSFLMCHVFE